MSLPEVKLGEDPAETFRVEPKMQAPKVAPAPEPDESGTDLEWVSSDLPDADMGGSRMSGVELAWVMVSHWFRMAAETGSDLTSNPMAIGSDPPESWAEYRAYVDSRAWIPDDYEGKWLIYVPLFYYNSIGCFGFAFDGLGWLFKRQFRFIATVLTIAVAIVLWLCFS